MNSRKKIKWKGRRNEIKCRSVIINYKSEWPQKSDNENYTICKMRICVYVNIVVIVQLVSHVLLFVTPWTVAHQASLSFNTSQNLLKLMSTELVMPSNHLILCHFLLLLPSIFPCLRVFSNELSLHIRWPKYWTSTSASVLSVNIQG